MGRNRNAARRQQNKGGNGSRNDRTYVYCKLCTDSPRIKEPDWIWLDRCYIGMPEMCRTCKALGNFNTWDKLAAKIGLTPPKTQRGNGGNNGAKPANAAGEAPTAMGAKNFLDQLLGKEAVASKTEDQELSQEDTDGQGTARAWG